MDGIAGQPVTALAHPRCLRVCIGAYPIHRYALPMHDGGMMSDTNTPTDAMTNSTTNQTRLLRSREQRIVAGLAGGLGQRFGVSPWWFRAGFIVLSAFGGLGLALYAIGWLLIPEAGHLDSIAAQWIGGADGSDASTWIGAGLLALAGLIVLGWIGVFDSAVFWAALLFLIGVMLYRGDLKIGSGNRQVPTDPDQPAPGSDTDSPEAGPDQDIEADAIEGGGDEPPPSARQDLVPDPASPPSPKKPRSIVGSCRLGLSRVKSASRPPSRSGVRSSKGSSRIKQVQ